MKKSELNSICEEIYSRQITDLKSKIKEIAFESRDGSSNFEDFFANTIPILCKSSINSTIDVLQSANLLKIEDD